MFLLTFSPYFVETSGITLHKDGIQFPFPKKLLISLELKVKLIQLLMFMTQKKIHIHIIKYLYPPLLLK